MRNASKFRIHPEKEFKKLLIHGILHLLGYDHEADKGRMLRLQRNLVRRKFYKEASPIWLSMTSNEFVSETPARRRTQGVKIFPRN